MAFRVVVNPCCGYSEWFTLCQDQHNKDVAYLCAMLEMSIPVTLSLQYHPLQNWINSNLKCFLFILYFEFIQFCKS